MKGTFRHRATVLALAAFVLLGAFRAGALPALRNGKDSNGMPLALYQPPIPTPVWLHASAAVDEHGALHKNLIDPATAEILETLLSQPEVDGCIPKAEAFDDVIVGFPRYQNLDDDLRTIPYVLLGRVTGLAPGLSADVPGTLVRLEVVRAIRGYRDTKGPFYVFMPVGKVRLGAKAICKTDSRYTALPGIGDEVLALTGPPYGEQRNLLAIQTPGDLITFRDKRPIFPKFFSRHLADDPGPHETLDDLVWRLDRYNLQNSGSRQ